MVTTKIKYDEIQSTIRNLDLYNRVFLGQYDDITEKVTGCICFSLDRPDLHKMLCDLRRVFIPSLPNSMSCSLGIWGNDTPATAVRIYDVQQCLRYQLAYYHSKGETGIGVSHSVPMIQGNWNMTPQEVSRCRRVLEDLNIYPDFRAGYVRLHVWNCPVIITRFNEADVDIEYDETVKVIMDEAACVMQLARGNKITELFKTCYPDVDERKFAPICEDIENYLKGWLANGKN